MLVRTVVNADISFDPVPATYWWQIWTAGQVAMYGHLAEDPDVQLTEYTMEMVNAGYDVTGADYASALRDKPKLTVSKWGSGSTNSICLVTPTTAVEAWPHQPNSDGTRRSQDRRGHRKPVGDPVHRALEHTVEPCRIRSMRIQRQWNATRTANHRSCQRRPHRVPCFTSLRTGSPMDGNTPTSVIRTSNEGKTRFERNLRNRCNRWRRNGMRHSALPRGTRCHRHYTPRTRHSSIWLNRAFNDHLADALLQPRHN